MSLEACLKGMSLVWHVSVWHVSCLVWHVSVWHVSVWHVWARCEHSLAVKAYKGQTAGVGHIPAWDMTGLSLLRTRAICPAP